MRTLIAGGAQTALCAANPFSTQDDVAAALVAATGPRSTRAAGEDAADYAAHLARLVARGAADRRRRRRRPDRAPPTPAPRRRRRGMLGATEETTTGLVRLRAMEARGELRCAVLAVNEALTERAFNDRYGTGQSTLDGILRATDLLLRRADVRRPRLRLRRQGRGPARARGRARR